MPTREELLNLAAIRSDACVSIYLNVSPLPQGVEASRIALGNLVKEAYASLREGGLDKRRLAALEEQVENVIEVETFWRFHANSLALLASPDCIRTYRLANAMTDSVVTGDRFYLKPLFRALTFPQHAYILALSENAPRVIEFFTEGPPEVLKIPNMPENAFDAIRRIPTVSSSGTLIGEDSARGHKMRLAQYAKKVDEALRPVLMKSDAPLVLMSTEPLGPIFRAHCTSPNLLDGMLRGSPDRIHVNELVEMAREVLDRHNAAKVREVKELFDERKGQRKATADFAEIARAATYGMIDLLIADFDRMDTGFIDDAGKLTMSADPKAYNIIDEIVKRSFAGGARIMAVRAQEMIGDSGAAAILRYPL